MRDSITFFSSYIKAARKLPPEDFKAFVCMICDYAFDDIEPETDDVAIEAMFELVRPNIDNSKSISAARSEAGRSGGKAKQTQANESKRKQTETNESKAKQTQANASEIEEEIEGEVEKELEEEREGEKGVQREKQKRFSPPSLEEVTEYCSERQNSVDPNRFIDFYSAKGWKVGNQPMKDWKAAVRTWENRDNGYSKSDRPPNKKTGGIYAASMSGYGYVTADGEIVSG